MQLRITPASKSMKLTEKPCDRAEARRYVRTERFTLTDDVELDRTIRARWKERGSQHRESDGVLYRDVTETSWFFEWQSTGPLKQLVSKFGPIILRQTVEDPEMWEVIIGAGLQANPTLSTELLAIDHPLLEDVE